jgi:hypothetical protein
MPEYYKLASPEALEPDVSYEDSAAYEAATELLTTSVKAIESHM